MDKLVKMGIRYLRASAFLILFLLILYIIFVVGNMLGMPFYSFWGIVSYILLQLLLPVYVGILIFFILLLLAEMFDRVLVRKEKEEDA